MYLNCHTFYSLRYGTIPVEGLVDLALEHRIQAVALTDINTITGIYDFALECFSKKIKPICGVEFRNGDELLFIALAKNFKGIGEMCRLLTHHDHTKTALPKYSQFENVVAIYPLDNMPLILKDNEYIGIRPEEVVKLYKLELRKKVNHMVILQPVTFRTKKEYNLHTILRAIDHNVIYTKLKEESKCKSTEVMMPIDKLLKCFSEHPQIIRNSGRVIEDCSFDFDYKSSKNKITYTGSLYGDQEMLRGYAYDGMLRRYGKNNFIAKARIEKELDVIGELGFAVVFLIHQEIIRYSLSQGFYHVGRGSGANSIIAYCIGITDICPIELNLYFERFLNANRTSAPDFDIDWGHKNRDTMLTFIFKRWGKDHVGFCGTIGEFKFRSKIRELGKVFGLAKEEMDSLTTTSKFDHEKTKVIKAIHEYGGMLEKYPNQRSMHSCGVLISEEPITNYTALEMMPKGFPIVQFDMHIADDIGFDKYDILSQRGISTINETVDIVEKNTGVVVDIRDTRISKNNPELNVRLNKGKTLGCFYIESPAMRGLMRRIGKMDYIRLVIASSIIRPGVAKSGMMSEYIHRVNKPGSWISLCKVFAEHLEETCEVMVYQEDVIKIGIHFAGLNGNDADTLRRAISGKKRSLKELQGVKDRFFNGALKLGHSLELIERVYSMVESFAGFSFCKAHSASYAVESYMSLYLKHNYPVEFMVAAINNEGGFYRTEVYIHEARMAGANINLPCLNTGEWDTSLYGKNIYLGFKLVDGLQIEELEKIIEIRKQNGNYKSLEDFIQRINPGIETLKKLIFVGAFRFTGQSKGEMVLKSRLLLSNVKQSNGLLFQEPAKEFKLPKIQRSKFEDAFDEIETIGFPVSVSPYDLLMTKSRGDIMESDLLGCSGKIVRMMGYLIARKQVPTKRGDMYFGTWIDAKGELYDTAHFADCLTKYPFKGGGVYLLLGKVQIDYNFPTIVVQRMEKLPFIADPRFADDEDLKYKVQGQLNEDISSTERAPYPRRQEVNFQGMKAGGLSTKENTNFKKS